MCSIDGKNVRQLTYNTQGVDDQPEPVPPDGSRIAFVRWRRLVRGGMGGVNKTDPINCIIRADGSDLWYLPILPTWVKFTPDGKMVVPNPSDPSEVSDGYFYGWDSFTKSSARY